MRCLDASHDRGFKRINNGIARHALHARKPAAACGRYHVASGVVTGLLKISPDFRSKKIKTQIKTKFKPPNTSEINAQMLYNFALSTS